MAHFRVAAIIDAGSFPIYAYRFVLYMSRKHIGSRVGVVDRCGKQNAQFIALIDYTKRFEVCRS